MSSIVLKTTTNIEDAAVFIASSILNQLSLGKNVLFFVTGGSSISVGIKVAERLSEHPHQNLTIMLTDERYGEVNHIDSNWYQLIKNGFLVPQAKLIPILNGEDPSVATKDFNIALSQELQKESYKIGLFGVGADGHTAGILPRSIAVNCQDNAFSYNTPTFHRITITPKTIEKLNEAIIWIQGENKWNVIKDILEKDIDTAEQPAQILKKIPLLTIFTDYKKL